MIQRYPILEYLDLAKGIYKEEVGSFELEIRRNGYDFVLLTQGGPNRSQIYGVIGVSGESLEMHASVGLPNIITFKWPNALDEIGGQASIEFTESDVAMGISLHFSESQLEFVLLLDSKEKARYVLRKT